MLRVWLFAVLGCAHGVSRPQAVPPPREGRVVLASDALREQVDAFSDAWSRRLSILGATAHVTYDDNRAVFDLDGAADLDEVAHALADATPASLDDRPVDGYAMAWLPATATCACSSRVRVVLPTPWMCGLSDGPHVYARDRVRAPLLARVRFVTKLADNTVIETARTACTEAVWAESVMFALPPGLSQAEQTQIVLGLGGGVLPAWPRIVR